MAPRDLMDAHRKALEASRLLPLAKTVLDSYPFRVKALEHLATHSNVMYRVVTEDGRQKVLRLGRPHAARINIEYEVSWLAALDQETTLDVVRPILTQRGSYIVDAIDPESGAEHSCVLFSWVPGIPLGDGSGSVAYRLLGEMSAGLHVHGAEWRAEYPAGMQRWEQVFYYDQEHDPVVIDHASTDHLFDSSRRRQVARAEKIAAGVVGWTSEQNLRQVVHGDLHEWNVHMAGSRLYAFDFEDVMFATRAQDVSVSLYSSRSSNRAAENRHAFRMGYESVAPWPIESDEQLDGLHAARQIMLMNYAARTLPMAEAEDYLNQVMPWLEGFLRRYG